MGGSQSTRKIIVEGSEGEGVVKISEDVVKRIKGIPEKDKVNPSPAEPTTYESRRTPSRLPSPLPLQRDLAYERAMKKEIEEFYTEKLDDLHKRNHALQEQTNEQFATAVKEVEKKFLNYTLSPICQDLQQKVLECYQANPSETLNCSPIVTAFTSCVERARISATIHRPQSNPPVETAR